MTGKFKTKVYRVLEPGTVTQSGAKVFGLCLSALILLNVAAVMADTVKDLSPLWISLLRYFEIFSVSFFSVEYILRIWVCTENEQFSRPLQGRLKYIITPIAIMDALAIMPFYLPAIIRLDLRYLRVVRLFRIIRIFKLARYSDALKRMGNVIHEKKEELLITASIGCLLLLISASLVYVFEKDAQPDKFSSIPAALWWAIVTMTTVGYGDIYPITAAGKAVAGALSFIGIGLVALPAGIFASGFAQEIQRKRQTLITCPHCGEKIDLPHQEN